MRRARDRSPGDDFSADSERAASDANLDLYRIEEEIRRLQVRAERWLAKHTSKHRCPFCKDRDDLRFTRHQLTGLLWALATVRSAVQGVTCGAPPADV